MAESRRDHPVMLPKPLPVKQATPGARVNCLSCAQCCTYVAIEIEEPSTLRNATDILWFLYHERVSVLMERKDRWTLLFDSRCKNLGDDLLCKIYPYRPHICRGYDDRTCEVNGRGSSRTFRSPEEFLEYMKEKRPRTYRLLEKRFLMPGDDSARKPERTPGRASGGSRGQSVGFAS